MKSEGFNPENLSDEEKARLAAEAQAAEEKRKEDAAKQGIGTNPSLIDKEDLVLDSENFNISVDRSGKVSRKAKKSIEESTQTKEQTFDEVEITKEEKRRKATEAKKVEKAKIAETKIALEKEAERTAKEAELLNGGAEYVIDEKGNKRLELTKEQIEHIQKEKKAEDQEKIAKIQAERYGIKDHSLMGTIGKGLVGTALSMFGARLPLAAIDLYSSVKNKKGAKVAASELLEAITLKNAQGKGNTEPTLTNAQIEKGRIINEAELIKGGAKYSFNEKGERILNMTKSQIEDARDEMNTEILDRERTKGILEKKTVKSSLNPEESIEVGPVRDRIRTFNDKLKAMDMPASEKKQLRDAMAKLLNEHRHDSDKLEAQKTEKISDVFDVYANNSAKVMGVAKETINTASICMGLPFVRLVGYSLFSGAESFMKAGNIYDRNHFKDGEVNTKEKLAYIGKSLTVDAATETLHTYTDLLKKDSYKDEGTIAKVWGKAALKTFSLGFTALRVLGLYKFEEQLRAGDNILAAGGEKFVAALGEGKVGEALKQGGENWVNNAKYLLSFVGATQNPNEVGQTATNNSTDAKSAYTATGGSTENNHFTVNEKATEVLAGEGPQHAIARQVKDNLPSFGFKGDVNDAVEVAKFVSHKTHDIVTANGLDDVGVREAGTHIVLNQNGVVTGLTPENTYQIPTASEAINHALIKQAVMDDNASSFDFDKLYMSGSGDKIVQEFDKVLQFDHHIKDDIFHIQSSGKDGLAEWDKVQFVSANDILDHKYGDLTKSEYYDPSGSYAASTKLHYDRLADDLKTLNDKTPVNDGENVYDYYKRAFGIRSTDLTDYINNPTIAEQLHSQEIANKIKDIYTGWFGINQIEEWQKIKNIPALDAIAGKFGSFVGNQMDATEAGNRTEMQNFLKEIISKTKLTPKVGEVVEAFIMRANKISSLKV